MTPATLLKEIALARAKLAALDDDRKRLAEYIGALELAASIKGVPLTSIRRQRSVSAVDVNTVDLKPYTKRAATRSNRTHPGLKALYEKDVTQASLAREMGETRSRVASWFATGALNRPIPRSRAVYLRDTYGVPESVWERIAD